MVWSGPRSLQGDLPCPGRNEGDDPDACAVTCHPKGKKADAPGQVAGCKRAEAACRAVPGCGTVSLAPDGYIDS